MKRISAVIVGCMLLLFTAGQAGASSSLDTYDFKGTISSVNGIGNVSVGNPFEVIVTTSDNALQSWEYIINGTASSWNPSTPYWPEYSKTVNATPTSFSLFFDKSNSLPLDTNNLSYGNGGTFFKQFVSFDGSKVTFYSFTADLTSATKNGNSFPSVPIPAVAWLLGSGLIGLVGMGRKSFFGKE